MVPLDFVSVQMQIKAVAVADIDCSILWLICVVDYTIFAVLYISMNLYIIVSGVPTVKLIFGRRRPKDCTVEHTAVLEAVWQTADIDASALAE